MSDNTNTPMSKTRRNIHNITKIGILAAISTIVMLFEFPLWFAPGFYELDLSESVILMGGFAMGPWAAVIIEFLKNLLNLLLNGTSTSFVGEFANFVTGCAFVVPASLIYKYNKNRRGAVIGLITATFSLAVIGSLFNYFFLIPAFSKLYEMPIDTIVGMGTSVNPWVTDLKTLVVFAVAPFNLVKGIICSLINLLLYKHLSRLLHS